MFFIEMLDPDRLEINVDPQPLWLAHFSGFTLLFASINIFIKNLVLLY